MRLQSYHGSQKVQKRMVNIPQGETSSQPTPKIQAIYASESELLLKDQCVDFEEEILVNKKLFNCRNRLKLYQY